MARPELVGNLIQQSLDKMGLLPKVEAVSGVLVVGQDRRGHCQERQAQADRR